MSQNIDVNAVRVPLQINKDRIYPEESPSTRKKSLPIQELTVLKVV